MKQETDCGNCENHRPAINNDTIRELFPITTHWIKIM
jgi:hypothetical protein